MLQKPKPECSDYVQKTNAPQDPMEWSLVKIQAPSRSTQRLKKNSRLNIPSIRHKDVPRQLHCIGCKEHQRHSLRHTKHQEERAEH